MKTKVITLLEIAIVLCSVFLVALPAIAAEQNQEMQKVSATANEVTTASEGDYVLGIYSNANGDDTIDMGDVVYIKLAIFGKKPKTELCDAKYDGRINVLDVIQTKLIILGKEKELTIVDTCDTIVTVKKPIERVVVFRRYQAETLRALRAQDKVVGVTSALEQCEEYFPEISKLPKVGTHSNPDYEAVISLNPDLVIGSYCGYLDADKLPGVTILRLNLRYADHIPKWVMKCGYILDKEDEARHYLDDFWDKYIDLIKARTKGLSDEERPTVYEESFSRPYKVFPQGTVEAAGGRDIFAGLPHVGGSAIDPEMVIERNPDVIIKKLKRTVSGYRVDNPSEAKKVRDEMVNRPELAEVKAVKNGRVYVIGGDFGYGLHIPLSILCYAKWFHPDLFEDLELQAIHQEYLTEFQRLDYDLSEHGVFVYPSLED